jgi:NitT/TauT family transport system ATP-binding protein
MNWLKVVGLERFAEFWPKELSGGMKKRCQIAVVLANEPDVLLMDEPFGALDYSTKCELQEELLRILHARPRTVFFVTHDIEEAAFLADRVVVMAHGRIAAEFQIGFPRPRPDGLRLSQDFARLRQQLSAAIEEPRKKADALDG